MTYSQIVQSTIYIERENGKVSMVEIDIWGIWYTEILFFGNFWTSFW